MSSSHMRTIRNLSIFTLSILLFSLLGLWVDSNSSRGPSGETPGMLMWLVMPFVTALLLRWLGKDGWKDIGLRFNWQGKGWAYALSCLIYPVAASLVMGIGLLTGQATLSIGAALPVFFLLLVQSSVKNVLEEGAFRGYLAPRLESLPISPLISHVIVGIIWGAWHLPYLSFVFSYLSESPVTLIPRLFLGTIAASLVYGEIRLLTKSVWPAFLMHTIGGAFVGAFVLNSNYNMAGGSALFISPGVESVLMITIFFAVGLFLAYKRSQRVVSISRIQERTYITP